ncbi:hypothetical protein, partial [Gordonibacter faecis]
RQLGTSTSVGMLSRASVRAKRENAGQRGFSLTPKRAPSDCMGVAYMIIEKVSILSTQTYREVQ